MYKCFVGTLPNIVAFQLLFVGCLTHDSTKVPTSTFKSRHHQKKASPFFPLPQPLIMSCSSSLLTSPKPPLIDTYIHLRKSWRNLGILLVYCRSSLKSSDTPHRSSKQSKQNSSTQATVNVKPHPNNKMHGFGVVKLTHGGEFSALPPIGEGMSIKDAQEKKRNN